MVHPRTYTTLKLAPLTVSASQVGSLGGSAPRVSKERVLG